MIKQEFAYRVIADQNRLATDCWSRLQLPAGSFYSSPSRPHFNSSLFPFPFFLPPGSPLGSHFAQCRLSTGRGHCGSLWTRQLGNWVPGLLRSGRKVEASVPTAQHLKRGLGGWENKSLSTFTLKTVGLLCVAQESWWWSHGEAPAQPWLEEHVRSAPPAHRRPTCGAPPCTGQPSHLPVKNLGISQVVLRCSHPSSSKEKVPTPG